MDADPPEAVAATGATQDRRCPACSARCAPTAPWCSLCFADLRQHGDGAPSPLAEARAPGNPLVPGVAPDPQHATLPPRALEPTGRVPRLPVVSDVLAGRGGPVVVMLGGTVLVGGGAVVLMWLVGTLL